MMDHAIFGDNRKWKGKYPIGWCDLCERVIISCPEEDCKATSCNCASCEKCSADIDEFNEEHYVFIEDYLTTEEQNVLDKIRFIQKYMLESIRMGDTQIDWAKMDEQGSLCDLARDIFKDEIEKSKKLRYFPNTNVNGEIKCCLIEDKKEGC